MDKQINVALLTNETGPHIGIYLSILGQLNEVDKVFFCDTGKKHIVTAKQKLGDKLQAVYEDPRNLFKKHQVPLAFISMDAKSAPAVIDLALDHGCHIYAEKPACTKLEEFEPLVKKADSKHLNLMLALANRSNPEVMAARRLVRQGVIGKIYGVDINLLADQTRLKSKTYQASWLADKKTAGGGYLTWLGLHWLDMGMYVTNSDITDVTGYMTNVGGEPINIEDSVALSFRFDNGSLGSQTSGYYLKRGYHAGLKIWGSKGWLSMDPFTGQHLEWALNKDPKGTVHQYEKLVEPRGYLPFIRSIVRSSMDLEAPPITSRESLRILRTIFAFYKAAKTGQSQKVVID